MKILFSFLLIFYIEGKGQNLVNNPSFEEHTQCPKLNVFSGVTHWANITNHFGTPDYYNVCGDSATGATVPANLLGYQSPQDGDGYIGVFCFNTAGEVREYVQTRLSSPLIAGEYYRISFFTSLSDYSTYASNNIGAALSTDSIIGNSNIAHIGLTPVANSDVIITDKINWNEISGVYKAIGGEKFLVLGNFYSDVQTSKVLLDSAFIGLAYYFIDNVTVSIANSTTCSKFEIYPNPSSGIFNTKIECESIKEIKVYSSTCQLVKENSGNITSINLGDLPDGSYFLVLVTASNKRKVKKIIKIRN